MDLVLSLHLELSVYEVNFAIATTGFPLFSTLWDNYPLVSKYSGRTAMIDAAGLGTHLYGANTCAIRLSYALIHSGHEISIEKGQFNWSEERATRATGRYKDAKYIIRVATMRKYLEKVLGPAKMLSKNKSTYKGSKGIIVFQDCPKFTTATGHVDLYDGSRCVNKCFFDQCNNIHLFPDVHREL
ncbi:predicted protein [Nematostella vectensis]|uniref:Uncharacterized protein n=1 Tax=Nematostella vectensis TaxID=45351 RepID=A7SJ96_NEMVE|nr:predicted protein [Nematostella vectensis]|eukprot:XP_001628322.1 predicted protein [Nematostella vectensis]